MSDMRTVIIIIIIIIFTSLRERDKREKSEEKIDCHHQDLNQGPSLVASDALTTELWCSRHPSRDCSTFSSFHFLQTSLLLLLLFGRYMYSKTWFNLSDHPTVQAKAVVKARWSLEPGPTGHSVCVELSEHGKKTNMQVKTSVSKSCSGCVLRLSTAV